MILIKKLLNKLITFTLFVFYIFFIFIAFSSKYSKILFRPKVCSSTVTFLLKYFFCNGLISRNVRTSFSQPPVNKLRLVFFFFVEKCFVAYCRTFGRYLQFQLRKFDHVVVTPSPPHWEPTKSTFAANVNDIRRLT